MAKWPTFLFTLLIFLSNCFADTFIHHKTGETFNGYVVQKKRGNKTQVRIENASPEYIDISSYQIKPNYLGRKNKVIVFTIEVQLYAHSKY